MLVRRIRTGSGSPARLPEETVREVLAPYEGEEGGAKIVRAARALHPDEVVEVQPALRERRVHALVMWGEHDAFLPAATVGRPPAEPLGVELRLLPGGHFVPLDCPRAHAVDVRGSAERRGVVAAGLFAPGSVFTSSKLKGRISSS